MIYLVRVNNQVVLVLLAPEFGLGLIFLYDLGGLATGFFWSFQPGAISFFQEIIGRFRQGEIVFVCDVDGDIPRGILHWRRLSWCDHRIYRRVEFGVGVEHWNRSRGQLS